MTGEDHNTDALIAALQSSALPAEQVGEAAAVAAMIEAQTRLPAVSTGRRPRRGVAIAAVTVASLGLGGLVAAGPGIFSPAADRPATNLPAPIEQPENRLGDTSELGNDVEPTSSPGAPPVDAPPAVVGRVSDDLVTECGNHGRTVASIAQATGGDAVAEAARSTCGLPELITPETDAANGEGVDAEVTCADGNHGETVSSVARATESGDGKGEAVRDAARSVCGKPIVGTEPEIPGQPGDAPGQSGNTPGQSGNTPGRTGGSPGQAGNTRDAPGRTGDAPGQAGNTRDAPGRTGDAPGQAGNTPGQTGNTPGQTGNTPGTSSDKP